MSEPDDNEIIKSVLSGNTDDFEIILRRYEAYVFSIVSKHLPAEMVEDGAHEVFIRVYGSLHTYRAKSPLKHWISKISVRYCYDFWRGEYRSKETAMAALTENHSKGVDDILSGQSQKYFARTEALRDSRELLEWALSKLTAKERMVITLLYLEELPVKETADLLGWSVINVKVKAHRSKNKLRKILSALAATGGWA